MRARSPCLEISRGADPDSNEKNPDSCPEMTLKGLALIFLSISIFKMLKEYRKFSIRILIKID